MKTALLSIDNPDDLARAGELLQSGELVAVPTETVYGLAADASNPAAVAKIFSAKNRPQDHPLITHIHSVEALSKWAKEIPDYVAKLIEVFWPGPLTLILSKQDHVSDVITGGKSTIGLRMPNQPALLNLLSEHNLAIAAPSANPYQQLSPTTAEQVMAGLGGRIAAVLDGGQCQVGSESTILAVFNDRAQILRAGAITMAQLAPFIPVPLSQPAMHGEVVSGNKEIHYQPHTPVKLKSTDAILASISERDEIGLLSHTAALAAIDCRHHVALSDDVTEYRHDMYQSLYQLDQKSVTEIWVEIPPDTDDWLDINDRLSKASA